MSVSGSFEIDLREIRDIGQKWVGDRKLMNEIATSMAKSGGFVRDAGNARIKHKTYELSKSATVKTRASASAIETVIRWGDGLSPFNYAAAVNFGRKAFGVKFAKALRFVIDGQVIFRKSVGPAPAQYFAEKGLEDALPRIEGEMASAVGRWSDWLVRR